GDRGPGLRRLAGGGDGAAGLLLRRALHHGPGRGRVVGRRPEPPQAPRPARQGGGPDPPPDLAGRRLPGGEYPRTAGRPDRGPTRTRWLILSARGVPLTPMSQAQPQKPTRDWKGLLEKRTFKEGKEELPYRLLEPADYEKEKSYPLVVFLHGAGGLFTWM